MPAFSPGQTQRLTHGPGRVGLQALASGLTSQYMAGPWCHWLWLLTHGGLWLRLWVCLGLWLCAGFGKVFSWLEVCGSSGSVGVRKGEEALRRSSEAGDVSDMKTDGAGRTGVGLEGWD